MQVYGGSLPVSAAGTHFSGYQYCCGILSLATPSLSGAADRSDTAGRFCLSHLSHGSSTDLQSSQHQSWQESQPLDHRSHSFPLIPRDAVDISVTPSQWPVEQLAQYQAGQQQSPVHRPPLHAHSSQQLHSISRLRQSLGQGQTATNSFDSSPSDMTISKTRQTVLVWDLDETLILFHSLLSGAYASHHSPEVNFCPCTLVPSAVYKMKHTLVCIIFRSSLMSTKLLEIAWLS